MGLSPEASVCSSMCHYFSSESGRGRRFFSLRVTNLVKSAVGLCFVSVACPSGSQPALACCLPYHRDPNVVHGLPVLPPHVLFLVPAVMSNCRCLRRVHSMYLVAEHSSSVLSISTKACSICRSRTQCLSPKRVFGHWQG